MWSTTLTEDCFHLVCCLSGYSLSIPVNYAPFYLFVSFYSYICSNLFASFQQPLGTMSDRSSRSIYVGNLPGDIRESEIEDLFYKVGSRYLFFFPFRWFFCITVLRQCFSIAVWPHCWHWIESSTSSSMLLLYWGTLRCFILHGLNQIYKI